MNRSTEPRRASVLGRRLRLGDDRGVTLVEVLVSMSIMSIVGAMVTVGLVQIHRLTSRSEARSTAQSQVRLAMLRLDKEVRYAAAISQEGVVGNDQYAEFLVANATSAQCVQLRVSGGQLQRRTWTHQASPVRPTAWTPIASDVTSPRPFRFIAPDGDVEYQRLEISLTSAVDAAVPNPAKGTKITFTALNSTRDTETDQCTEGRGVA
jgi:prepilin-type N-terminal cleavage/methylation domain-containing protein